MIVYTSDLIHGLYDKRDWYEALIPFYRSKIDAISKELIKNGYKVVINGTPVFCNKELPTVYTLLVSGQDIILCENEFSDSVEPKFFYQGIGLDSEGKIKLYLASKGIQPKDIDWWVSCMELQPELFNKKEAECIDEITGYIHNLQTKFFI